MNLGGVLLSLALCAKPFDARPATDHWFGRDKVAHAVGAAVTTAVAYRGLRIGGAGIDGARVGSIAIATAAAVGKECFDRRRGRLFSWRDLLWGALGIVASVRLQSDFRR